MGMTIDCPKCDSQLAIEESFLGKKIRCTACQSVLQLPETLPEVEEEIPTAAVVNSQPREARVQKRKASGNIHNIPMEELGEHKDRMKAVAKGLNLHLWKMRLIAAIIIASIIAAIVIVGNIAANMRPGQVPVAVPQAFQIFAIIIVLCLFGTEVLGIMGTVYCCKTPDHSGQRFRLIFALILELIAIGIHVATLFMEKNLANMATIQILESIRSLFLFIAFFIFIRFIYKTCMYIQDKRATRYARGTLNLSMAIMALLAVIMLLAVLRQFNPKLEAITLLAGIIALVMVVLGLWWLIRFERTLSGTRDAIHDYIEELPEHE